MNQNKGIPQEALRTLALVTMLIDHMGVVLFPRMFWLRGIGRLAFPIFAFLLAEGADHTRHPFQYLLRLAIAAIISEIPFDYMVWGRMTWRYQNVMLTLLLALSAILALKVAIQPGRRKFLPIAVLAAVLCTVGAEHLNTDYGAFGVMVCLMFWAMRRVRGGLWISAVGFLVLCQFMMDVYLPGIRIPIESLGVAAFLFMGLYRGWRYSRSRVLQWVFYLYYPVHMTILVLLAYIIW